MKKQLVKVIVTLVFSMLIIACGDAKKAPQDDADSIVNDNDAVIVDIEIDEDRAVDETVDETVDESVDESVDEMGDDIIDEDVGAQDFAPVDDDIETQDSVSDVDETVDELVDETVDEMGDDIIDEDVGAQDFAPVDEDIETQDSVSDIDETVDEDSDNDVVSICGDNIINGLEACDDGNAVTEECAYGETSCIVCDSSCQNAEGETNYCGDGVINSGVVEVTADYANEADIIVYHQVTKYSDILVSDNGTVNTFSYSINMSENADAKVANVTIIAPDGTPHEICGDGCTESEYSSGSGIVTTFDGKEVNGTWRMKVYNAAGSSKPDAILIDYFRMTINRDKTVVEACDDGGDNGTYDYCNATCEPECRESDVQVRACLYDGYDPYQKQICSALKVWENDGDCYPPPALDSMVLIPGKTFWQGCRTDVNGSTSDTDCDSNESPYHQVSVPSFQMDVYEVTNVEYNQFLNINGNLCYGEVCVCCTAADDYLPRVGVSWYGAKAYCEWIGKRLPSESEWELAARGTDERLYPWGNEIATCDRVVMGDCTLFALAQVGYQSQIIPFPEIISPYGLFDMVGNVSEWVEDDWHANYSVAGRSDDGNAWIDSPVRGSLRVVRGGAYAFLNPYFRVSVRYGVPPDRDSESESVGREYLGFRCASE